jgi:hypothetical protein
MTSPTLAAIEKQIDQLSREEQLWLIEYLASRLRKNALAKRASWEADLAAMAADPAIQSELRRIEEEFRVADFDGLEDDL